MKINLSHFKKISSDKDCTVMRHKDGHEMRVAHKPLTPAMLKELMAMESDQPEPEKMAKGGEVKKPEPKKERVMPNDFQAAGNVIAETGRGEAAKKFMKATGFAYGTEDVDYKQERAQNSTPVPQPPINININGQPAQQAAPAMPTPEQLKLQEAYNQRALGPQGSFSAKTGLPDADPSKMFSPEGAPPQEFSQSVAGQAVQDVQSIDKQAQEREAAEKAGVGQNAELMAKFGAAPAQTPPQQQAEPASAGLAPEASPLPQEAPGVKELSPTEKVLAGIQGEADALGKIGDANAASLKAQQDAFKKIEQRQATNETEILRLREGALEAFNKGEINANNYYDNLSTGQKIQNSFAILLSGLGAGVAGQENLALKFIDKQIENDIDAQKANLGKKKSLVEYYSNLLKDERAGSEMAAAMLTAKTAIDLQKNAAKLANPIAQAKAQQAIGALQQAAQEKMVKAGAYTTISQLARDPNTDPKTVYAYLDDLAATNPEAAKDLRERYTPNVGLANTAADAKNVKEGKVDFDKIESGISRLLEINSKGFKSANLDLRAEAGNIQTTLIGALNRLITGGGPIQASERELLQNLIADPTKVFSLDSSNKIKLNQVLNNARLSYESLAKASGIQPLTSLDPQMRKLVLLARRDAAENPPEKQRPNTKYIINRFGGK